MSNLKILDSKGVSYLWSKISMEDYPNNDVLVSVINAIDNDKANKTDLDSYLLKEEAKNLYAPINIINTIYPVGSIYISTNNINPGQLFGIGTWEQIEDRFLLGAGSTYTAGNTGGEAEHTLTELEMPAHDHDFDRHQLWRNETVPPSSTTDSKGYGLNITTLPIYTDTTTATGAGEAHNNMPPYLVVYMWKRLS